MNMHRASSETTRPIRPVDFAFLAGETHAEPLHVGALLMFDGPSTGAGWTPADLVAAYRASRVVAPFNRVAEFPPLRQPRWIERGSLDMQYHVQHLRVPRPGGERELCELVQELHSAPLDRGQPLFRAWVIEGLADGGIALYTKVHHALVDGISGMMRVVASLSTDARASIGAPFFASMPAARGRSRHDDAGRLARATEAILEQAHAAGDVSIGAVRKLVAALAGAPETNTLFVGPVTPINMPVRNGRALALLSLPMDELRKLSGMAGATINDVMLAVVDAAVNDYLIERHAGVRLPLVAMVPVSLRDKDDTRATTKASAIVSALGDPGLAPRKRLRQIIGRMEAAKADIRAMSKAAATGNAVAMYVLAVGLGSLGIDRPAVNLVVSNVPGPEGELFLGGARLRGLYPASIVSARVGLNVTLASQGGKMHVGLVSDRSQLPDPERLAQLCLEAFEALQGKRTKRARPAARNEQAARARPKRRRTSGKGA